MNVTWSIPFIDGNGISTAREGQCVCKAMIAGDEKLFMFGGWSGVHHSDLFRIDIPPLQSTKEKEWRSVEMSGLPTDGTALGCLVWVKNMLLHFGTDRPQGSLVVYHFDLDTNRCYPLRTYGDIPISRNLLSAVVYNDVVWMYGGSQNQRDPVDDDAVYTFDPISKMFKKIHTTNNPPARHSHTAVVAGHSMIVHGGCTATHTVDDVYTLNLQSLAWERIKTKGESFGPTMGHSGCLLDNRYLVSYGGMTQNQEFTDHLRVLDTQTWQWLRTPEKTKSPFSPGARYRHFLVSDGEGTSKVLLYGGCTVTGAVGIAYLNDIHSIHISFDAKPVVDEEQGVDVMISLHCSSSSKLAKKLQTFLEGLGYKIWICLDMAGGVDYREAIVVAASHSRAVVALANEQWAHSKECNYEMNIAQRCNNVRGLPQIIPILISSYDVLAKIPLVFGLLCNTNGIFHADNDDATFQAVYKSLKEAGIHPLGQLSLSRPAPVVPPAPPAPVPSTPVSTPAQSGQLTPAMYEDISTSVKDLTSAVRELTAMLGRLVDNKK